MNGKVPPMLGGWIPSSWFGVSYLHILLSLRRRPQLVSLELLGYVHFPLNLLFTMSQVSLVQRIPSFVRLFRDFSIADFAFTTVSTIAVGYSAFTSPYVRSGVCEELSRQPDLLRDIAETGLSLENCEFWFERAIVVVLGISVVLIAIRVCSMHRWMYADELIFTVYSSFTS